MSPLPLNIPNVRLPFPFVNEKEEDVLGVLTLIQELPLIIIANHGTHWRQGHSLRAIAATALLVKATEKHSCGIPLAAFVSHTTCGPPNFYHIQHFSVTPTS